LTGSRGRGSTTAGRFATSSSASMTRLPTSDAEGMQRKNGLDDDCQFACYIQYTPALFRWSAVNFWLLDWIKDAIYYEGFDRSNQNSGSRKTGVVKNLKT
jgi:hypothetical protein